MTMMGSQDLRRLLRDMLLDAEFEHRVRAGLAERADELEADLAALEQTEEELRSAGAEDDYPEEMTGLHAGIEQWRAFIDLLRSDFPLRYEDLLGLLRLSAVRSDVLNCLLRIPAGAQTLVRNSLGRASFRLSGPRRFAPPTCLFYLSSVGCVAGEAKPAKCANFFCTGDPNVLGELRRQMEFDDFVLSYFEVTEIDLLLARIRLEHELGEQFIEPKIVLGADDAEVHALQAVLGELGCQLRVQRLGERPLPTAAEAEQDLMRLRAPRALLDIYESIDGAALYELALALDQMRLSDLHPAYVLTTRALRPAGEPHPMWDQSLMAQPLGALDMYVLDVPAGEGA